MDRPGKYLVLGVCALLTLWVSNTGEAAGPRRVMTSADLVNVKALSDPQVSPDGRWVAFTMAVQSVKTNRSTTRIYIIPAAGGPVRKVTSGKGSSFHPRWSPDGLRLAFVSSRAGGGTQLYVMPVRRPGEARRITNVATGVSSPVWSPDGRRIVFVSRVYPLCRTQSCNTAEHKKRRTGKVKARVFDGLLYRHWNHWRHGRVKHLLSVRVDPAASGSIPVATDLTPGRHDVPPVSLGSSQDFTFSADGRSLCFVKNTDKLVAASTNNDLFLMPSRGGRARRVTKSRANDNGPAFSPDGRHLAYRAMKRPGYESDRYRLVLVNLKTRVRRILTPTFDRSVREWVWDPRGKGIFFTAKDRGYVNIHAVKSGGGPVVTVVSKVHARYLRVSPGGKRLYFVSHGVKDPPELFMFDLANGKLKRLTGVNTWLPSKRAAGKLTSFWFKGGGGDRVHAFLLWPPPRTMKPGSKVPVVVMIHGGPQGMAGDDFHPRWNSQLFAAPGYAVLMVNFHGSTGYGQSFTDSIRGDWGGKPYRDIMLGLEAALKRNPRLDRRRVCAVGASYGGFMVNWIGGHTRRFRCLISHAGVYNITSKYGTTEELWFPEWEFRGTPWGPTRKSQYTRWSPHNYVQNWVTPTLVIHGQHDYRVTVGQGMQLFTALQRRGVKSRFLYFPDEDHFVSKPQNRLFWWKVVHGWLARFLKR